MASIRFKVRYEDKTEITANPEEISMGMRVITHIGKPVLKGKQDIADALIQEFGKKLGLKKLEMGYKL